MAPKQQTEQAQAATETAETVASIAAEPTKPEPVTVLFTDSGMTKADVEKRHADGKGATIANAAIVSGVKIGPYDRITLASFAVSVLNGKITVYAPASGPRMFYKHVGARLITETVKIAGVETAVTVEDPIGKAQMGKLMAAVADAWAVACENARKTGGEPFNREIPLSL